MVSNLRTLNHLELVVFREIVRCGGITAAADKLNLAKSAVSKYLSRLEDRLQSRLLVRSSRRISLTPEGRHLLPMVESLIAETERLVEIASEDIAAPQGQVRIATSHEFGNLLMEHFLPQVIDQYPALKLTVKLGYAFDDLQDPAFDLAFRILHVNDERLVSHQLGMFKRILVAHPDFSGLSQIKHPSDLEDHNCMIFSSDETEREWPFLVEDKQDEVVRVKVSGNLAVLGFSALLGAARAAAGITYVPEFVAQPDLERGSLVRVLPAWHSPSAPVYIAYRFGTQKIARIRAVIDLAREKIPQLLDQA